MAKKNLLVLLILTLLLSSCYTHRTVGLLQERKSLPTYENATYHLYRLQLNDEIQLRVLSGNEETASLFQSNQGSQTTQNSFSYRVRPDSTVSIPFVGPVKLLGHTLNECEEILAEKLKDYAPDIEVKVALTTGTFCVVGDAGRGYFSVYKDRLTIFQALALFGGPDETADYSKVKIIRQDSAGKLQIKSFDIRTASIINSEYYYIYPNDIIYLDTSKNAFWGVSNYSTALNFVNSSFTLFITVWVLMKSN